MILRTYTSSAMLALVSPGTTMAVSYGSDEIVNGLKRAVRSETVGDAMVALALICLGVGLAAVNATPRSHALSAHDALRVPNQTLSADSLHLTRQEKRDLVTFMRALTDTSSVSPRL